MVYETGYPLISLEWNYLNNARSGDQESWQWLVDQYYQSTVNAAFLITGSIAAAQDIAQQTFLSLIESHNQHTNGSLGGYVATIAYRLSLKEKFRNRKYYDVSKFEIAEPSINQLDTLIGNERMMEVAISIKELDSNSRDILVLRFYSGMSLDQIGQLLEIPLGTVKSRLFYAIKKCRDSLFKKGILP